LSQSLEEKEIYLVTFNFPLIAIHMYAVCVGNIFILHSI